MNAWNKNQQSLSEHDKTRCNVRKSHIHDRMDLEDDLSHRIKDINYKIANLQEERDHLASDLEILTREDAKYGNKHQVVDFYRTLHRANELWDLLTERNCNGWRTPKWVDCSGYQQIEHRMRKALSLLRFNLWYDIRHGEHQFTWMERSGHYDREIKEVKRLLNKAEREIGVMTTSQRGSLYNHSGWSRLKALRKPKIA